MTIQQRFIETVAPGYARERAEIEADLAESRQESQILRDSLITFGDLVQEQSYGLPSPAATLGLLQEQGYDSGYIQLLRDQLGWEQISALGTEQDESGDERAAAVRQSRRLFRYSPLDQWSIWLWAGWGLGDRVTVTLDDKGAQEWWNEFATAERNEPIISEDVVHELSDWLLVKGNRFIVFTTATMGTNAGRSTARVIDQSEMALVCSPRDKTEAWFYKRTFTQNGIQGVGGPETLYYPDYRTFLRDETLVEERWKILQEKEIVAKDAKRADLLEKGTAATVFHIAHNRKEESSPWGWPLSTAAGSWIKGHKQFSEARLGVAVAVSQFVRRSKVKGGTRAVASIRGQIASTLSRNNATETNPPGAAGSWHVENQASDTKELPMRTGAGDAKDDNELFSWMALLGLGLFPTSAGLDTSRWATAVEMDKAQAMLFERYQRFWSAQFRKMVRIVLMLGNKYGGQSFTDEETKANISTDTFSLSDFPDITDSISKLVDSMLTPYVEGNVIPEETAAELLTVLWKAVLQALAAGTPQELTKESFLRDAPEEETTDTEPAGDQDEEPGMESDLSRVIDVAIMNVQRGDISPMQFAEFGLSVFGDVIKGEAPNENQPA